MKYKVGDRVRIVNKRTFFMNDEGEMDKYLGQVMTISKIVDSSNYKMKEDNEEWYWKNEMIKGKAEFTKSDLQDGDIVTYRNEEKRIKAGERIQKGMLYRNLEDYNENLTISSNQRELDIIKVERPTQYETVFEHKEEILDEKEKEYLSAVIRPWRDRVKSICKFSVVGDNREAIYISIKDDFVKSSLASFDKGSMYINMEINRLHT